MPEADERFGGAEQSDQVLVGLGDGVPAVAEPRRVAADAPGALDDPRAVGADRVRQLAAAVVAVNPHAQRAARLEVIGVRGPDAATGDTGRRRVPCSTDSGSRTVKPSFA